MKKLLFGLITTVMFGSIGFGQSNNPFNQYGKDIVYVSKIIADDYKQGKFKEVSQETLDYYYDKYLQYRHLFLHCHIIQSPTHPEGLLFVL